VVEECGTIMNMEMFWYVMVFVFGTIIGSFLNVVIYRMHTGKSLNGRSHCMTCGTHLSWHELFPVLSYLIQRAKCRHCEAYIPYRYLVVELITGASFVMVWHLMSTNLVLFFIYAALLAILIVILVYDMRHTIIPDELTIFVCLIAFVLLGYGYYETKDGMYILYNLLGGIGAASFFGGLWYVSGGKWLGLGDAKLAFPLAIIVGYASTFSMIVLSFWIGAAISLTALLMQQVLKRWKTHLPYLQRTITMRSEVPFAPFLIAGFLLVQFFNADIFVITQNILPF
jgi:leader peptidase (prepilin peptidase) / N-methyltransferase